MTLILLKHKSQLITTESLHDSDSPKTLILLQRKSKLIATESLYDTDSPTT